MSASIKLDTTAPVITLTTPEDGATYVKDQVVLADWSTQDAYSGVASDEGTVASGDPIDTAGFGARSFTVSATDVAGNTATTTVGYSVPFASAGVLAPLSSSRRVAVNGGSVPVKFQVMNSAGKSVSTLAPVLYLARRAAGVWGQEFAPTSTSAPKSGTTFRYDAGARQYVYNLNTKVLPAGTYRLRIAVGGGGEIFARIQVK